MTPSLASEILSVCGGQTVLLSYSSQSHWALTVPLLFTSCLALDKSLNLFDPQFSDL